MNGNELFKAARRHFGQARLHTAPIEREQVYRARCASTGDQQGTRSFLLGQVLKHISNTSCRVMYKRRNVYVFADREVVVR